MNTSLILLKKPSDKNFAEIFIAVCLFILNPLIALIGSIVFSLIKKNGQLGKIMVIVASGFLGLINVTKSLESDLLTYQERFLSAQYYSLLDYLSLFNREYLYYLVSYSFYHLTEGTWIFFIFIITFFSYYLLFKSIFIVIDKAQGTNRDKILIVLSIAFFYPLFSYSAHLVRNFIAGAIILNFCISYFFEKKNKWWLLCCAVLIHTSSVFFIFIYFIPQKINFFRILKTSLIFFSIFILLQLVFNFDGLTKDLYLFRRLSEILFSPSSGDHNQIPYITGFLLYFIFITNKTITSPEFKDIKESLINFNYLFLLVVACAIGTSFIAPLMSERFLLFIYFLSTIFISTSIMLKGIVFQTFRVVLPTTMIIFFGYKYVNGTWSYTDIMNLASNSLFDYFL